MFWKSGCVQRTVFSEYQGCFSTLGKARKGTQNTNKLKPNSDFKEIHNSFTLSKERKVFQGTFIQVSIWNQLRKHKNTGFECTLHSWGFLMHCKLRFVNNFAFTNIFVLPIQYFPLQIYSTPKPSFSFGITARFFFKNIRRGKNLERVKIDKPTIQQLKKIRQTILTKISGTF